MNRLWKRFDQSLDDDNGLHGIRRLVNNATTISAMFEANGIITEAQNTLFSLQQRNKKIDLSTHYRDVDNVLVYVFLKGLQTIPSKTKAYRLGLIDINGKLIRQPKTKEENECISNIDLLMFKLRDWLKPKMGYLSTVSWVKNVANNVRYQNYFSNTDMVAKHYIIRKLNDELNKLLKKG